MLVALPAGGCGGDKLDTGTTAPEAPAAAGAEAGAARACAQVVPGAGGEGVAAAPTETQTSASNVAAAAVATGNGGGDHSCQKTGDRVRSQGRREETGVSGPAPRSPWCEDGVVWSGSCLPPSSCPTHLSESSVLCSAWFSLGCDAGHAPCLMASCLLSATWCLAFPSRAQWRLLASRKHFFPFDPNTLPCHSVPISLCGSGSGVSLPFGGHVHTCLGVPSLCTPNPRMGLG